MKAKEVDPVIDEIREIRHRISAECDHDPKKLLAYYAERQKQHLNRLLNTTKAQSTNDQSAA